MGALAIPRIVYQLFCVGQFYNFVAAVDDNLLHGIIADNVLGGDIGSLVFQADGGGNAFQSV